MRIPNPGGYVVMSGGPVRHGRFDLVMDPALAPLPQLDQVVVVLGAGSFIVSVSDAVMRARKLAGAVQPGNSLHIAPGAITVNLA